MNLENKLPRGLWHKEDGTLAMSRCPVCEKENYAFNVLSGVCTWCGYDANGRIEARRMNDFTKEELKDLLFIIDHYRGLTDDLCGSHLPLSKKVQSMIDNYGKYYGVTHDE